jgi:hypothetical protein
LKIACLGADALFLFRRVRRRLLKTKQGRVAGPRRAVPVRHVPAFKALTQLIRLEDERSGLSGPTVGVMWRTQEDPYFPH